MLGRSLDDLSRIPFFDDEIPLSTFIFIRHGQVAEPWPTRVYGGTDVPLSTEGARLTREFPQSTKRWPIQASLGSDLSRASELARGIADFHRLDTTLTEELREIDRGGWVGRDLQALRQESPDEWAAYVEDPDGYRGHGGESGQDLVHRVRAFLDARAREYPSQCVSVAAHGMVIRAAIAHALDVSFKTTLRLEIAYLSVTVLSWSEGEGKVIRLLNGTPEQAAQRLEASS